MDQLVEKQPHFVARYVPAFPVEIVLVFVDGQTVGVRGHVRQCPESRTHDGYSDILDIMCNRLCIFYAVSVEIYLSRIIEIYY